MSRLFVLAGDLASIIVRPGCYGLRVDATPGAGTGSGGTGKTMSARWTLSRRVPRVDITSMASSKSVRIGNSYMPPWKPPSQKRWDEIFGKRDRDTDRDTDRCVQLHMSFEEPGIAAPYYDKKFLENLKANTPVDKVLP